MGVQILAGSKAVYLGPGKTEPWKFREGIDCVVTQDTCAEADHIPVIFECEEKEVSVCAKKLKFTDRKTEDY